MLSVSRAAVLTFAMGAVILFCRAFPFLFFRERPGKKCPMPEGKEAETAKPPLRERFLSMVEKTVPPAAMTVLAFNAMAAPIKENPPEALPVLAAAGLTAALHLWKRNTLLSIAAGTALYMVMAFRT